ncbi:hypothetical protein DVDV_0607 [Desulfovibrio sp. DV]|nr:hypothetical protein DVDV_0607 [Desulfovibrio sp. DV]
MFDQCLRYHLVVLKSLLHCGVEDFFFNQRMDFEFRAYLSYMCLFL